MPIVKKTEIGGTTGEYALDVYVKGGSSNPLVFKGTVTTATDATHFASTDLIGYGNDALKDWYIYVFYDTAGTDAAPQGEQQPISDYVSSTGTFTHTAFTADLAVGDEVFIMHPYEATGGDATEAKQDTIIADITVGIKKGVERTIVYKMVDATDFATPETGVDVTEEISKDGGAFAACTNADSEISAGWYKITLTATEMNASEIIFKGTGAGCAQCDRLIITEA